MKKLFLFFVATIISNPAMAYNVYDNGNLSVDVDGEFAGYGLYNSSNANYDKTFRGVAYGNLGLDISKSYTFGNLGLYGSFKTAPYTQYSDDVNSLGEGYVYLEGNYGRFELGNANNISRKLHISSPDVGILSFDGQSGLDFIFAKSDVMFEASTAIITDNNKTKFSYVSPSIYGFQFAGSYIPDTGNDDLNNLKYGKLKDGFTTSLKYSYNNNDSFKVSVAYGEFNDTRMPLSVAGKRKECSIGTMYYTRGIQLSASYKDIKEDDIIFDMSQDGYALNFGLAYEIGPLNLSLTQHKSKLAGDITNPRDDTVNITLLSSKLSVWKNIDFTLGLGRMAYKAEDESSDVGFISTTGLLINF